MEKFDIGDKVKESTFDAIVYIHDIFPDNIYGICKYIGGNGYSSRHATQLTLIEKKHNNMKDRILIDGITYIREDSLNRGFKQPSQEALNELYRAMGESERCVHPPKDDYSERANRAAKEYFPSNYMDIQAYLIRDNRTYGLLNEIHKACIDSFIDGIKWANKNVHYPDNWIIMEKPDQEAIDEANKRADTQKSSIKRHFLFSGFMDGVNWQKNRKK